MSEQSPAIPGEVETQFTHSPHDPDWFLQTLIEIVNKSNASFGLTLNLGGILVSGDLIGGKHYFDGFGQEFASSLSSDPETVKQVHASFASHSVLYVNGDGIYKDSLDPPNFIHLKDARFFHTSGQPIPANRGVWWRGRLAEVGGFSLGKLSSG